MKAIVLAGGGGTRLWPLSRESFPKQFIHFGDRVSLLQKTVQRLLKISCIDDIVISTNAAYASLVRKQTSSFDKIKILTEPCKKNTAPAICLALQFLKPSPTDTILVLPSDHLMEPEAVFFHALKRMDKTAAADRIITFGIRPTKPETGYGYIRIGNAYNEDAFEVAQFVEKPDVKTAQKYVEDPSYYWNSGMFLFSVQTFWQQLKLYAPDFPIQDTYEQSAAAFHLMPEISIDYALLEKSPKILVCPLAISWSDIGSWDSLYEIMKKDRNQNVKIGKVLDIDTKNSLIFGGKRLISTIGLEDLIIVESEDATFIGKKGESQKVRQIVQELLKRKPESKIHQEYTWGILSILEKTPHYTLSKATLFPNQSWEPPHRGTLLSLATLHLQPLDESELKILNQTDDLLHFLLIEKP